MVFIKLASRKVNLVITKSVRKTFLTAGALAAISVSICLPAYSAPTPTELVQAITGAKILPASVSINARYNMGEVSLYMYRGKVPDNDLKIDSVLITKALHDRFGQDVKSVQLNFYDKDNKTSIRQCTVSQTHINSFATKQISQQQLLDMLTIARMSAGGSASGGGGGSYSNPAKEAVLAAVCTPGFKEGDRGKMLIDIKEIAKLDGGFGPLFARWKQIDDMIKAGKTEEIIPVYNALIPKITLEQAACNNRIATRSMDAANEHNRAQVQAAMMGYVPHTGYAYRRRATIWARIKAMNAQGHDVSPFIESLVKNVDGPLGTGNYDGVRAGIIRLEQQLGIPVTFIWQ